MNTIPDQFRQQVPAGSLEVRSIPTQETRALTDADTPRIEGLGSVYGQTTTIGSGSWAWDEQVMPGAWTTTISRDDADILSMFNHDPGRLLGRTTADTLRLDDTDAGLQYSTDINPDDTLAVSVFAQVERGDVSGASVWFRTITETWTEPTDDNGLDRPLRQIEEAELFEVGPVVFPAFPTTTAAAARSMDAILRGAGVTKDSRRASITVDLLTDPDRAEARIQELFRRQPSLREKVCEVAAAATPPEGPSRTHVDVRRRTLQLLERNTPRVSSHPRKTE